MSTSDHNGGSATGDNANLRLSKDDVEAALIASMQGANREIEKDGDVSPASLTAIKEAIL